MINILVRTVILYAVVLFIIRVMGKGELSKLDPFQVVILFMIAELAALPIETPEISIFSGLTALLTLLLLQVIFSTLSLKSRVFKNLVSGKATIIIEKGNLNESEMKNLRITMNDLMEQLRLKNFASISDVEYAILEANGDMSVIPMPGKSPITKADMGIDVNDEILPLLIIANGTLYPKNLQKLKKEEYALRQELAAQGYPDYSNIFLCYSDESGKLFIYPKAEVKDKASQTPVEKQRWDVE
jgi:uncharacterized membrane protein YcaP (DUF421 family)